MQMLFWACHTVFRRGEGRGEDCVATDQTVFALEGVHASALGQHPSESNNSTLTVHMPRLISKFRKVKPSKHEPSVLYV